MRRTPLFALLIGAGGLLAGGLAASAAAEAPKAVPPSMAEAPTPAETAKWCGEQAAGVRALSDQLRHRSVELDERERTIGLREATLNEVAARIEVRLEALQTAKAGIDAGLDRGDAEREERVAALVKMVETNRAGSIAPMIAALEPGRAVEVLDRMSRSKAGKLLAELPGPQAAALAQRMTDPIVLTLP